MQFLLLKANHLKKVVLWVFGHLTVSRETLAPGEMTDYPPTPDEVLSTLKHYTASLPFNVSSSQLRALADYVILLEKWNTRFRFSRYNGIPALVDNLILPSLSLASVLPVGKRLVDLGSGPGIPGIPIAILMPELHVTCVESKEQAVEFIRACRESIGLVNLDVAHGRAEELAHESDHREAYDRAVSRAFAPLPIVVEIAAASTRQDGLIAIQCAGVVAKALDKNPPDLSSIGCRFDKTEQMDLPRRTGAPIHLARFIKTSSTPDRHPRSWKAMKKRPLWDVETESD